MTSNKNIITKKLFFFTVLSLIFLTGAFIFVFSDNPTINNKNQVVKEKLISTAQRLQHLIRVKEQQGVDVSKARELDRKSREAFNRKDLQECLRLLNEAIYILEKSPVPETKYVKTTEIARDYFYEVHLEPGTANSDIFDVLKEFVNLADKYKIKLTLLFTPQWAEMILADKDKKRILNSWKSNGHEIGGHHHCPQTWPWDGYSNLSMEKINKIRASRPKFPGAQKAMKKEKYIGNMKDFVTLLNKLAGKVKVITMCGEDKDWPAGVPYAAGGRHLGEAISTPRRVTFNGHEVIKLTSVTFTPGRNVMGGKITVENLKNEFKSSRSGIFGIVSHAVDYKKAPQIYEECFKFLNSIDPSGKHSKTISEILDKYSRSEKN